MSRRRPKGELQFGSDSFLDVVANIVGILIILIVIAGLRVSQTPVVIPPVKSADEPSPSSIIPSPDTDVEEETDEVVPVQVADIPIVEEPAAKPVRQPLPPPRGASRSRGIDRDSGDRNWFA